MQEAFLKVWQRWDRVKSLDDPAGYLFQTAFNLWRSRLRRALRTARNRFLGDAPVDAFAHVDDRTDLVSALRHLTQRQRAALVLVHLLGYSSEESGRLMGVRSGTIRSLAFQGRESLRSQMEESDG